MKRFAFWCLVGVIVGLYSREQAAPPPAPLEPVQILRGPFPADRLDTLVEPPDSWLLPMPQEDK